MRPFRRYEMRFTSSVKALELCAKIFASDVYRELSWIHKAGKFWVVAWTKPYLD